MEGRRKEIRIVPDNWVHPSLPEYPISTHVFILTSLRKNMMVFLF